MKSPLLEMNQLEEVASVFRALSHPLRLRIINYLSIYGSQHVTNIVSISEGINQAAVSQQLKILRDTKILLTERRGSYIFYSVNSLKFSEIINTVKEL